MTQQLIPAPTTKVAYQYLLGHLQNLNYLTDRSKTYQVYDSRYAHHFPVFTYQTIEGMLRDPRVLFGLYLLKGPIVSGTRFFNEEEAESPSIAQAITELDYYFPYVVKCDNKKQAEFMIKSYNRFWENGVLKALMAIEWGYSGSQIIYKTSKKYKLLYDNLHPYKSITLQPYLRNNGIIGFVRNGDRNGYIPVGGPMGKGFWHLHRREQDYLYGESRLKGIHVPWHETWCMGGARDIRRTWFFKNAYDGGELYYPEGFFTDSTTGLPVQNEILAVSMMEMKRTGSIATFPATKGLDGKRDWEYIPPKANMTPQGMEEYVQTLRDEELEGLGIPPEVVQSKTSGFGSASGREVPASAFISTLSPITSDLLNDFNNQIMDPVLLPANGFSDDYEVSRIVPTSIEAMKIAQTAQTGPNKMPPSGA